MSIDILAANLDHEFRLLVDVNGNWMGTHVLNQSQDDRTPLVRHAGTGNAIRFIPSPRLSGGYHMLVKVGDTWKGVHVLDQSDGDGVRLIRHGGDGNVFRAEPSPDGVGYKLLVQVGDNLDAWKGLHVLNQSHENGTPIIRHRGDGNSFVLFDARDTAATASGAQNVVGAEFQLLIEVSGAWKSVQVRDQSNDDGAPLVRTARGAGNHFRFIPSTSMSDGYHLLVEVGEAWKGVQVRDQSTADGIELLRGGGDGTIFKVVRNPDGTCHLLLQAHPGDTEWKGVHVQSQRHDDGTSLVRHRGNGNSFVLAPIRHIDAAPYPRNHVLSSSAA